MSKLVQVCHLVLGAKLDTSHLSEVEKKQMLSSQQLGKLTAISLLKNIMLNSLEDDAIAKSGEMKRMPGDFVRTLMVVLSESGNTDSGEPLAVKLCVECLNSLNEVSTKLSPMDIAAFTK